MISYAYKKTEVASYVLKNLKEIPFEIILDDSQSFNAIVPQKFLINSKFLSSPYFCDGVSLCVTLGENILFHFPSRGFLDKEEDMFLLKNISDYSLSETAKFVKKSIFLENLGMDNLSGGDSILFVHVWYSVID